MSVLVRVGVSGISHEATNPIEEGEVGSALLAIASKALSTANIDAILEAATNVGAMGKEDYSLCVHHVRSIFRRNTISCCRG